VVGVPHVFDDVEDEHRLGSLLGGPAGVADIDIVDRYGGQSFDVAVERRVEVVRLDAPIAHVDQLLGESAPAEPEFDHRPGAVREVRVRHVLE
jgi:hypothetical protein